MTPVRRGTVLPLLACCLVALFTFVALAVDLGMLAVSRTQCQNAADVAALVGARTLNNKPGVSDSNRPAAVAAARDAAQANAHLSAKFTAEQVTNVQAGMYVYDTTLSPPQFRADFSTAPAAGQSWTAMRVDVAVTQPTYFMRVFGEQWAAPGRIPSMLDLSRNASPMALAFARSK